MESSFFAVHSNKKSEIQFIPKRITIRFTSAMAFSSAFHERLEQMDRTRIQRLSLLQAEKELQAHKSRILASKLANIGAMEQRYLLFDRKIASQNFNILSLKSQIENLEAKYDSLWQEFRSLQNEVEEIEELHKMKDRFYEAKKMEMKEFKEMAEKFVRNAVNEKIQDKGKEYGSYVKSGKLRWFVRETGSANSRRGTIVFLHGAPTAMCECDPHLK